MNFDLQEMIAEGDPAPGLADLARLLTAFHHLEACPCDLAGYDPPGTTESRLAAPRGVADADRDFLRERCGDLNEQLRGAGVRPARRWDVARSTGLLLSSLR